MLELGELTPARKGMLIGSIVVLALCFLWILIFLFSSGGPPPVKAPDSPQHKEALRMETELVKDPAFASVGVVVDAENGNRLRVVGAVANQKELDRLKSKVRELHPNEEELDWGVVIE